jgi:long-chain acyl-CoA synthetase
MSIKKYGDRPALSLAFKKPITYNELGKQINQAAAIFKGLGLKKKDIVAILAENSPAWAIAYLAASRCGAVIVPILPDFPDSDVRHIITEAKVKFLFTTQKHIEKICELEGHVIEKIFCLDDCESMHIDELQKISTVLARGAELTDRQIKEVKEIEIDEDDLLAIIYTSGTSGHSKAVMLSHKNICSNVLSAKSLINIDQEWSFLSILPLSHAYEFTVGFILPLTNGARIVYAGKPPTPSILEKICREEKPTVMCIVPMIMEKIYKKRVMGTINESILLKWAVKLPWLRKKIMARIGVKLLTFFGGNIKVLAIGGAAINLETEKFLLDAGFPYLVGYGLTETSPILAGGPLNDSTIRLGSVGKVVPDVEVKIDASDPLNSIGEIKARGPNVMKGYYNNEKATQEVLDPEGWLSTGDLGYFDADNNLHIKGRSKSVIVLSHGENIYPEAIEEKINSFVQVVESLVIAKNERLEARVYLDYDLVDKEAGNKREKQRDYIQNVLAEIKQTVNNQLPTFSKLQEVREMPEPFVKTATHKIKRYLYT